MVHSRLTIFIEDTMAEKNRDLSTSGRREGDLLDMGDDERELNGGADDGEAMSPAEVLLVLCDAIYETADQAMYPV
jgi:hypothetical protein